MVNQTRSPAFQNALCTPAGGANSQAFAINLLGLVAGSSQTTKTDTYGNQISDAVIWNTLNGKAYDLGNLDVNDFGVVVGYSNTTGDAAIDAFVWTQSKGMVDLNSLLPAGSPWTLRVASAMNDRGEITGYGTFNGDITLSFGCYRSMAGAQEVVVGAK